MGLQCKSRRKRQHTLNCVPALNSNNSWIISCHPLSQNNKRHFARPLSGLGWSAVLGPGLILTVFIHGPIRLDILHVILYAMYQALGHRQQQPSSNFLWGRMMDEHWDFVSCTPLYMHRYLKEQDETRYYIYHNRQAVDKASHLEPFFMLISQAVNYFQLSSLVEVGNEMLKFLYQHYLNI